MARRQRTRRPRIFFLDEVLPMRPYLVSLMKSLREADSTIIDLETEHRRRLAETTNYDERRQLYRIEDQINRARANRAETVHEFTQLGIRLGDVKSGEMLFGCRIDGEDAYFIWYAADEKPLLYRFRGEKTRFPIQADWYQPRRPSRSARVRGKG